MQLVVSATEDTAETLDPLDVSGMMVL